MASRRAGGIRFRARAMSESGLSPAAASKALQRLAKRGRVAKLKDYFYAIVPL